MFHKRWSRHYPMAVTPAGDERVLRTIIDVQRAINDAEPTASAVMQIVADEGSRRPTPWAPWGGTAEGGRWCTPSPLDR